MVFRKNLRSLERRWEKISKFLGDLPSEQIFYRNIPLGAPVIPINIKSRTAGSCNSPGGSNQLTKSFYSFTHTSMQEQP